MTQLDPKAYWEAKSERYRADIDSDYHRNRLHMVDALMRPNDLTGHVLDFGCGDGVSCRQVLTAGGSVVGIDIDPSMVKTARTALAGQPGEHMIVEGGIEALAALPEAGFDTLLCLNVLAYLDAESDREFYRQAARILAPNGTLICTHSNELFDMFTLNRYTVDFFRRHFSDFSDMAAIDSLLTHPDIPVRTVFPTRENPLAYRHKLAARGFHEEQQEFSILHGQPPLLTPDFDPDYLANRKLPETIGLPDAERWKLMFTCSVFGVRAKRLA